MDNIKEILDRLILLLKVEKSRIFILCIFTFVVTIVCFSTSLPERGKFGYFVSCGFCILSAVLFLIVIFLELSSGLISPVKTLKDIQEVTEEIHNSFQKIQTNTVRQTFVGSNTIAGKSDFAYFIDAEKQITINRYFFISNAYDINFAVHSLNVNFKNVNVENYIWAEKPSNILADIFTNITIFPDKVIFTFSSRDDQKAGQPEIFKSSESKDVVGLRITSPRISKFISSYYLSKFHKIKVSSMDEVKKLIWQSNSVEYIAALVYSIIKEISADTNFTIETKSDQLGYAGLIGSFAEILDNCRKTNNKKHQHQDSLHEAVDNLSDVDVLLFISEISKKKIQVIQKIADEVCKRYKVPNIIEFRPTFDITPIKPKSDTRKERILFIQLIINDIQLHKSLRPSKLVIYDRLRNNVGFFQDKKLSENYGDVKKISVDDLIGEPLGLVNLKQQLSEKRALVRYWSLEDEVMREKQEMLESEQLSQFAKYITKWSLINFCRALQIEIPESPDSYNINKLVNCVKQKLPIDDLDITKLNIGDIDVVHRILDLMLKFV